MSARLQSPQQEALRAALLLLLVVAVWCASHNRVTAAAWQVPLSYDGDALCFLAMFHGFATGELKPLLPKSIATLGAPAGAGARLTCTSERR
jgi:hypothetical protein